MTEPRKPPESTAPAEGTSGTAGKLVENIMHFARVLRAAGMPVGPGQVIDAIHAVRAAGVRRRDDFYWTLHSIFVTRRDQKELFDQAFHIFWRSPEILERMMRLMLPSEEIDATEIRDQAAVRRLAEALFGEAGKDRAREEEPDVEFDASLTFSESERLGKKDFEQMSAEELAEAKVAIARLKLPIENVPTRRFRPSVHGSRIDMRATMKATLRAGGDLIPLKRQSRLKRHPPLVVLCDISGSMSQYSRMVLHFLHAMTSDRDRVYTFVFGTRLTNITRYLRYRDVDEAMSKVAEVVEDWDGGTRIGQCLHEFNAHWSRRVLTQGAVVLLITDGLDRDAAHGIEGEVERLHKSCRRLIWLNPLLRYEGFEPKSLGVRALLPHVDEFRPVHNIESLVDLADALNRPQLGFGLSDHLQTLQNLETAA